ERSITSMMRLTVTATPSQRSMTFLHVQSALDRCTPAREVRIIPRRAEGGRDVPNSCNIVQGACPASRCGEAVTRQVRARLPCLVAPVNVDGTGQLCYRFPWVASRDEHV